MPEEIDLERVLDGVHVDDAVFTLRPDYRVVVLAADGLEPGPSSVASEALLQKAEDHARQVLLDTAVEDLPHIAAWRDAYRAFGAKPQRTRNSAEALLRRVDSGLPRVDRLTDTYNAVSVLHQVPLGGEDLSTYAGPARLVRARGDEPFDTTDRGEPVLEHPLPGEVVWRDDIGVTCRRWNWRQGSRTRLTERSTSALFILDTLAAFPAESLTEAVALLSGHLDHMGPNVRTATRLIEQSDATRSD